jgi:hypothetical protein
MFSSTKLTYRQASKSGIPPGARWTKIDRKLVNPEALEQAQERFEERMDCVIVLRVLTKEEIQKLADRTKELRGKYRRSHYTSQSDPDDTDSTSDDSSVELASPRDYARPSRPSVERAKTAPSTPTDRRAQPHRPARPRRGRAWTAEPSDRFFDS